MPQTPTLAKRYGFKLMANAASVPVYLLMEALLPRALGPQMYGNYSFATNLFQQFSGFLDMGTSTCFYNALSRRQNEHGLVAFYLLLISGIAILAGLASVALLWEPLGNLLMPGVPLWLAPLAAGWAFFTWLGRVFRSMNDAYGQTVPSETGRTAVSLLGLGLLCLLFFTGWLDIGTLFFQQYLVLLATAAVFWHVCQKYWKNAGQGPQFTLSGAEMRLYGREFFDYSHPLLIQALLSFFMLTAERWLLRWFDGSTQQGFYALSQKVSMACFLFVSAMTPLLMRELSIAWGKKDVAAMGRLMTRFAPLLYALAAYFSCFTLVEAKTLVHIFGGQEFAAAILPVQIMSLYPLHQAYGQMAGSVFHATGRTKILRNITAAECVYGFAAAWFLLAPAQFLGLNLGAAGLAIKTVCVQIITVNMYLWLASRFIPFNFGRNLLHQLACLGIMLALAFASRWLTFQLGVLLPSAGEDSIWRFICSGIVYSVAIGILCAVAPQILGASRNEMRELKIRFGQFLARQK